MTKEQVVKHFGSKSKAARALRISPSAVGQWPDGVELTPRIAWRVELVTQGALKVDGKGGK